MASKKLPVRRQKSKAPVKASAKTREKTIKPVKNISKNQEEKESKDRVSSEVMGIDGKSRGRMSLPSKLFGVSVNTQLLAQAVRVYLANQRYGGASTKTRGEVEGSTRKIYRQKGTGKARHGGIRAPIFVGGGIAFGPKPQDYSLKFPKKMKRQALASALSAQLKGGNILIVEGFEKMSGKTKNMAQTFDALGTTKGVLFIVSKDTDTITRASRNLPYLDIMRVEHMNPYAVITHQKLVFMKEAISFLTNLQRLSKKNIATAA